MFVDEVMLKVEAGNGGDGCTAFRREKFVPMGGPYGGNGGHGSDIVFIVDEGLHTLLDLRYQKTIKGPKGENGKGKNQNGKGAEPTIVKVPLGTVVTDMDTGLIIADLSHKDQKEIIAKGGRGGRGNTAFKTQTNTAPDYSENGEEGEKKNLKVEVKLLADVGLVGLPSVGKSTIISCVSASRPKIAAYHFTTLSPNLGVVKASNNRSFVMADLPGLIEGASLGEGLGDKFLRHIERTRLLLHVIDASGIEGRDPVEDFNTINNELKSYSEKLSKRTQIIVANKADLMQDDSAYKELEKVAKEHNMKIFKISGVTGQGVKELLEYVSKTLKTLPKEDLVEIEDRKVYTLEEKDNFTITKEDGMFVVDGPGVQRIMRRVNLEDNESMYYFQKCLEQLGVNKKLKEAGVQEGDTVKVVDWELEWYD